MMEHLPGRATTRRFLFATTLLALMVFGTGTSDAAALTVRRAWSASFGSGRVVYVTAYTVGTATFTMNLPATVTRINWQARLYAGTCSSLKALVATIPTVPTDATRPAHQALTLSVSIVNRLWGSSYTYGTFAVRINNSRGTVTCVNAGYERATRVVVSGLGINLPVIPGGPALYCNVAMYQKVLSQPQEPGATFIYAHARTGMFLPLLTASKINNGASLLGRTVYVYTSGSRYYTYRIARVLRHQTSVQNAVYVTARQLWLQTSEGPYASSTKLVVIALPSGGPYATTYAASHPTPHPLACRV